MFKNMNGYKINQPQYEKLMFVANFFNEYIKKYKNIFSEDVDDGMIKRVENNPNDMYIIAEFVAFDVDGEEMKEFCKIFSYCSEFEISGTPDFTVVFKCRIPDVYIKDKK